MPGRLFALILAVGAAVVSPLGAAPDADKNSKARKGDDVFILDKVWTMHLTIKAEDWKKMEPTRRPFAGPPPGPNPQPKQEQPKEDKPREAGDRKGRGMWGFDFAYVKADLEIDGKLYKDVGVRFKGNASYGASAQRLKRPFKIDLDRYVEDQTFKGVKKLTLNNHVMDASAAREALSYAVYRAAGVPAPRTAYVQLTLTIPGKHDKEFLGLYTLVESIDKPFLKEHFGSAKGLLAKPERLGPLDYLGDSWEPYKERYNPKNEGDAKAQQRLIEFTRLIHRAGPDEFRKQVESYLDVDEFLRFLAGTVMLSTLDSFIGFGHNYYVYLDPRSNRFVFMPWDLDHSMGGFFPMGTPDQLADLSIRKPQSRSNPLVERLLADEKWLAVYKGHLDRLLKSGFTVAGMKKDLTAIDAATATIKEKEKKAAEARKEGRGGFGFGPPMMPQGSTNLESFVSKRVESVRKQLAGESKGMELAGRFGPGGFGGPGGRGPGGFLARPIMESADKDKDRKLSKEEATAAVRTLFKACDKDGKGQLDRATLARGLDRLFPRPPGVPPPPQGGQPGPGGQRPFGMPSPGEGIARNLMERAGKDGKVSEANLLTLAEKLFADVDRNKDGKLDEAELSDALTRIMMPANFGRPPFGQPPGERPMPPKGEKKEDRK